MPELRWRHSGNRVLLPLCVLRPGNPTDLTYFSATALLDTGATVSGLGPKPIQALGLESYGKNRLKSATDEKFVEYYVFRVGFLARSERAEDSHTPALPFTFDEIDGFSWSRFADFDVILGMDVLRKCDLSMDRDKRCVLRFG